MSETEFDRVLARAVEEYGDQFVDKLPKPVNGITFKERFLMNFIRANPLSGDEVPTDRQRLASAMKALFGEELPERVDAIDDTAALSGMADLYERDLADCERGTRKKPRSNRELARTMVDRMAKFERFHSREATIDRLRKQFPAKYELFKDDLDDEWGEVGLVKRYAMDEIERLLGKLGVNFYAD